MPRILGVLEPLFIESFALHAVEGRSLTLPDGFTDLANFTDFADDLPIILS